MARSTSPSSGTVMLLTMEGTASRRMARSVEGPEAGTEELERWVMA